MGKGSVRDNGEADRNIEVLNETILTTTRPSLSFLVNMTKIMR